MKGVVLIYPSYPLVRVKKIFLLIITLIILTSCGKQKDGIPDEYYRIPREFRIPEEYIGKSYEYIKATGYGDNWISTEDNNFKLWLPLTGEFGFKQYFELDSGECEKYLAELDAKSVLRIMNLVNYSIRSEFDGRHDIPLKYAKLQCISYHGIDQKCEEKINKIADEIIKGAEKNDSVNGRMNAYLFLLKSINVCEIRNEIGPDRIFTLTDSKKFRNVPHSENNTEGGIMWVWISGILIVFLFGLMFGAFKLKSGIKGLDNEIGKGNIGDYANLIKIILLGLAALVGLLTDFLSKL